MRDDGIVDAAAISVAVARVNKTRLSVSTSSFDSTRPPVSNISTVFNDLNPQLDVI